MPERYPLEAARALRAAEEDSRVRGLAGATQALERARATVIEAERAARGHRDDTERVRHDELERDGLGRSVSETLRAQDWLARRRAESRALEAAIARAREAERDAARAVEQARSALATARAEREAIEKHFAKWSAERARAAERRDEDEAEERRR